MNALAIGNPLATAQARAPHRLDAGSDEAIAHERRAFARYFAIASE